MAYLKDSGDVHKTTIRIFNPPGYLQDLNGHNRKLWSANYIGTWIQDEIQGKEAGPAPGSLRTPLSQFFDPTETAYDTTQNKISATWRGFPNRVSSLNLSPLISRNTLTEPAAQDFLAISEQRTAEVEDGRRKPFQSG